MMCPDYYASRLDLLILLLKIKQIRGMENIIRWSIMNCFGKIKVMNYSDDYVEEMTDADGWKIKKYGIYIHIKR